MGHHNIQFLGDPLSNSGVWSPPNSRANFCEEDYVITFYLAEFINALTNIAYVYLALRAMYPRGHTRGLLRPRWDFMSLALLVLGIGSFLFHATLRQTLEFADEFSMLGLTWSMLHAALTAHQPAARARVITVALAVVYLAFSGFYLWSAKIIYQVVAFEAGLAGVILRSVYVLHWKRPGFEEGLRKEWRVRKLKALGVSLLGYLLWNIDLEYCAELRALKAQVGLPWAWLFEFHGWWHILTAVGAAQSMQVAREIRDAKTVGEKEE